MKCNECEDAKFYDGNGTPSRYYCTNKEALKTRSCPANTLICKTARHSKEFTIKTSPKWCPIRKKGVAN